ncbi:MAG: HAD family hydrolase [Planctomycetota bacterium]|nr:HAD family hydrolase [Planctomycetota bacterium]
MRPRLIVSDLDGTLLDPGGLLSPESRQAIDELRSRGIEFILATGRTFYESQFALEDIRHGREMIGAAGALLTEVTTGRTVARSVLPADLIVRVTGMILGEGHLPQLLQDRTHSAHDYLLVGDAEVHPTMDWWLTRHGLRSDRISTIDDVDLSHTVRVGVVGGPNELDRLTERIAEAFGDELVVRHWEAVSEAPDQSTYLLELFDRGVDKWTMIEQVMRRDGLRVEEVAVIGDGLNDIQMLREAGVGIAMGQANAEVKAAADRVVSSNRDEGFAEAIRGLVRS